MSTFIEFDNSQYGHLMVNLDHVKYFKVDPGSDKTSVVLMDGKSGFDTGVTRKDLKYVLGRIDKRGLLAKDCPQ